MATKTFPAQVAVNGYAASELDMAHEEVECGEWNSSLVSQWTGKHVVVFDADHARVLSSIACEWSNSIDEDIDAGRYDDCSDTKRTMRAVMQGFGTLGFRLGMLAV